MRQGALNNVHDGSNLFFSYYSCHIISMVTKETDHPIYDPRYPARQLLALVGDKWTPIVLYCLSKGTRRFSEMERQIPDISKKMLIQTLRRLENDGLVDRKVYPVVPPKTEYKLTALGKRIHEPIAQLCEWAVAHENDLKTVAKNRQKNTAGRKKNG